MKWILFVALLCVRPLIAEEIPVVDRQLCQKSADKTLVDCSAARRYFHGKMDARHLSESPKSPGRHWVYLSDDEKLALEGKEMSLIIDQNKSRTIDGPVPTTDHSAKDKEICGKHQEGILKACGVTRAYFRQAEASTPGKKFLKKPAEFKSLYLTLDERALLSKWEENSSETQKDQPARRYENVNENDRAVCASFAREQTEACLEARDYFRLVLKAQSLKGMPKQPKGFSEYLGVDERKAYAEKADRLLTDHANQ